MEILVVTGMSGAGKSMAINVLEDIDFYCIENMMPKLLPAFAELLTQSRDKHEKAAVVIDARSEFSLEDFEQAVETVKKQGHTCKILFMDASDDVIRLRYKETRRRHPLSSKADDSVKKAIILERELLEPVRAQADFIIDTSNRTLQKLRKRLTEMFAESSAGSMKIHCMSFGFKYGIPSEADFMLDVRCLPNPYYVDSLRAHTGIEENVRSYVMQWPQAQQLTPKLIDLLDYLIPLYREEGKSEVVIAIGCTGGHHRSVVFAQLIAEHYEKQGLSVSINHRDIEK